ncbi:helix-turn-helix domain-containing protein [Domibacillus iocasae]|uniref:helix-turn-helix domain-containing protein n=1 Tax=Domibacillus iocasae TaxID=1714016 RepID=UPI000ABF003A|nr:helix-turn-helix transcriptional regulator [Domibacillus iocasae]
MVKGNIGRALKEARGTQTQLQLSIEENVSRETISAYENGRAKLPPDISRSIVGKKDDPWLAMAVRHEYTRTGPVRLEGKKVDLHRSSTKEKLLEELEEAKSFLEKCCMSNHLSFIPSFDRQDLEETLVQLVDVITGIEHFLAVVCEEAEISYLGIWQKHYNKLIARGYVNQEQIIEGQA